MNDDTKLLISRLADTSEWQALEQHLLEQRDSRIRSLIGGHLTHEQYLATSGEVRGIELVLIAPRNPSPRRPAASTTSRN